MTWAVVLGAVGGLPRWVFGVNTDAPLGLVFGVFDFVAGITCSAILALTQRHRRFEEMSLARFAAWGAVGGLLLSAGWIKLVSLGMTDALLIAPTFAVTCAACASASLALARRAATPRLPEVPNEPSVMTGGDHATVRAPTASPSERR